MDLVTMSKRPDRFLILLSIRHKTRFCLLGCYIIYTRSLADGIYLGIYYTKWMIVKSRGNIVKYFLDMNFWILLSLYFFLRQNVKCFNSSIKLGFLFSLFFFISICSLELNRAVCQKYILCIFFIFYNIYECKYKIFIFILIYYA